MKRERKEFKRDGYTLVVDTTSGERVVTRVRDGENLAPPKKETRRNFAQKAVGFAKSAARHVREGMPQATDEQVAERFTICQACPHFTSTGDSKGECAKCGCGLKAVGVSGINKLRWAGESCPVGRWAKIN